MGALRGFGLCGLVLLSAAALVGCPAKTDDDQSSGSASTSTTAGTGATEVSTTTTGVSTTEDAIDCWQHYNREDCEAEGATCQFEGGGGYLFEDGVCTTLEDFGWCVPGPFGGAAVPTTWWEPATGRVFTLGLNPGDNYPPGWQGCGWDAATGSGCDDPPSIEACRVCFCGPDGAETGTSGPGTSGTSSTSE